MERTAPFETAETGLLDDAPLAGLVPAHRLFEEQARRTPNALALSGSLRLTYRELDRRANALARQLRSLGVGPDVRVGLCLDRSPELVVSALGVLKSGGAYVALDPTQPEERLSFELADCRAPIVLVRPGPLADLAASRGLLCLSPDLSAAESAPKATAPQPDHLAYVIYTSGSTGRPKGVEVTHRGLSNLVAWHVRAFEVTSADRATLIAGVGFDASVWEVWPYLAAGASLHVVPEEIRARPAALRDWLVDEGVTVSFLPTPLAEAVMALEWPSATPLRTLLAGGDRLHQPPPSGLPFVLVNNYGPTEGTVVATSGVVSSLAGDHRPPSIGRPLPHMRAFVVDGDLQPVFAGGEGELLIGGPALARGYLGRPDLTAASFVPDVFCGSGPPGERLYRTGDLVRRLPDGELDFLGRIDDQVKIRGHRIELGEVEAALLRHPEVREAVVLARDGRTGKRLMAWLTGAEAASDTELRELLLESLPEAMVPSTFVRLEALPLAASGKVDRSKLPEPAEDDRSESYVPPRNAAETRLAAIWSEVLACGRVGIRDSFFALGGHSLLAGRILARIADDLGVELTLRELFAAPTVAGLAEALELAAGSRSEPLVPLAARSGPLPLSFAQESLWFLERLQPGRPAYNVLSLVALRGRLDVPALEGALAAVLRRHEALRTRFPEVDGAPRQEIAPADPRPLAILDLSALPADLRPSELERFGRDEARRPFDLARGPVARASLVRLGSDEHVIAFAVHHIAFDGWSEGVFWRELSRLYAMEALPEPGLQFADYAVWQRRRLEGPLLGEQLAGWRRRLDGLAPLELPTDRPRPARQRFRGAARRWALPAELADGVRDLARRQGATPFMTLLAAFAAVLSRTSAQEDFAVGSPLAGRSASGLEGLIGFFVNMMTLRMDLSGRPGLRSLLERVREEALAAFSQPDVPFELLVRELNPERDLSRNPLFQVTFQVVDETRPLPALPGIEASAPDFHDGASQFDLDLELEDRGGAIHGRCEYDVDLFDAPTVERLLGHLTLLIESAVADPERPVAELPLLVAGERQQLLVEWNDAAAPLPDGLCLHRLVEEQAERTPDSPAVVFADRSLTYRELDAAAGRLAARLQTAGVGPETIVGVLAERSPEMVVGLLAVLKAGGAYLPLDPDLPSERLAFMLADSRAAVVLTQERLLGRLPEAAPAVLLLDSPAEETGPLSSCAMPGNLAYVLYTSGSTGRPKAAMVSHRSIVNHMLWMQRRFPLAASDRVLQKTPFTFDASVWEFWAPLMAGAALVVALPGEHRDPVALTRRIQEHGATVLQVVPSLLRALQESGGLGECPSLRRVFCGGEALTADLVTAFFKSVDAELHNLYGPTETTVEIASWTCTPEDGRGPVPVGRPIDNTSVLILDLAGEPVPIGIPGELHVGGENVSRGYLGRPDLTAERFVPDPLGDGTRLYRTGDLARFRPDGAAEVLGRLDFQVKIRGVRVELGEVEAALASHPGVREVCVLARGEHLVAYLVARQETAPQPVELREFLRPLLPAAMIPTAFLALPSFPLNHSGKVDRKALAGIEMSSEAEAPADISYSNPVEELIAGLWEEVLGRSPIRPGDDFFDLGGHSLLAIRVVSRIREAFGVDLPLAELFASPTVAGVARLVSAARRGEMVLPPLRPVRREGLLPLSFPQQRLWFVDRLAPDGSVYNLPTAILLTGALHPAALEAGLAAIVRRHEVLRTRYAEVDGQPWQEVLPPGPFPLPFVDLAGLPEESRRAELKRIGWEEAHTPFDLTRAPMLRVRLVRLAAAEHALLLNVHHIASDGWSDEILRRELSALYAGSPLPGLPIQYGDFAAWQRAWPDGLLDDQLAWWKSALADLATLEIPADRQRPPVQTFRGASELLTLPPALATALRDLSRSRRTTLFMTLLGAWQALLHRVTGQADVAVGSPVANRTRPEIEGLIGFFINMLALRTGFGGDPGFAEVLGRVRRVALEAYDHVDVPFERLVDELSPDRDLSRQALVQVMFALVAEPSGSLLSLPGIAAEPLDLAGATAKFDLTLGLFDRGDRIDGLIEYSTDLFDRTTIARLAGQLLEFLAAVAAEPDRRLSGIGLLSGVERHQLLREWNDTRAGFPEGILMHQFFEAAVDRDPGALAAVWNGRELTYAGLEERANRTAHLLRERGVGRGMPVGIWMERSLDMVASVLAVLKAGGFYVPLDPAWPADRVESILRDTDTPAVLTREAHLGRVLEMQWRLPVLSDVICLDVEAPEPAPEPLDTEAVRDVFDLVAERATDRATAGGFVSSFTGQPFSEAEVDEYCDRVLALAGPWLRPDARVLEIGSGAGILLWQIAPRVGRCVGLDPSPLTQERTRLRAAELGLPVELPVGFAHEIEGWAEGSFDLIILASTAQFFPGPVYLERIVTLARRLLVPGGGLVIADVPDARRQDELRAATEEHRLRNGLSTRQDARKVLSVDEDFFHDLGASVLHRETGFDNELRFRYDVVLTQGLEPARRKSLWTSWHVDRRPAERLAAVAAPEDLAYVIHTSGSTGQPKGIVVQHRPVANLIAWINPMFDLGPSDRVLFVTSLCFDLSVWDIFGLLAAGGCVHVASEDELKDAERLVRILLEEPVTVWDSAPAALVRLAPLFPSAPAVGSRLRRVMLSGDWIPVTLPDRVRAAFPRAEITGLGGATEATVWSNWYPIGEVGADWTSIPYGRPMPNAQYHVLDAGLSPCPIGVPGDLYIGGDCLCVGYAQQPAVTAAAFVPDPFGTPGARLYRTGDRARYFPDGNLEFLGRIDHQVKIRGFRIELGEIELALARHAAVREAVVLAREDVPGDKRLVAYVVPQGELPDLKDFLRQTLPDYMIPAAFVELEALPVTPNGKLDRRALPAPSWNQGEAGEEAAPRTPTEITLAALWREILGVERVGVHDSFFDLGGHSLLATRLVARLRETFHVEMPLRVIFQASALDEMAAALDAALLAGGAQGTLRESSIRPVPRGGLLPLSFPQQRLWLVERLTSGGSAYHIPYALRLRGPLDVAVLESGLGALIERHEVLRTRFVERDGQPWQEILPPAPVSLRIEDASEADLERLAKEEAARPFDLAAAPPIRARLLRLGTEEHVLLLTLHHIASDGWSEAILFDELSALCGDGSARLPELPVQYADYAAWQRAWPEELLAGRLSYWTSQLAGVAALELPTDRPRPPVQTFRGASVPVSVPPAVAAPLRALAREHGATLFMLLLAAWQTLLHRITGQDDVVVGSPVANREQPELRGLVGFFVNLLPLRADFSTSPTFAELLSQVRNMAVGAYDHADVPFERLVDELHAERDLSRHPVFQTLFVLEDGQPRSLRLPGVETTRLAVEGEVAKFDLGLGLADREDEGFAGEIEYNADLFDRGTVERFAGHLGKLLSEVAVRPEARLSEVDLLSPAERERLAAWSGTSEPAPRPDLLHEAFAARAAETPGALALVWGERRLTYGELDERSDRLAARLRALGVRPEVRVGLCSARTPDLVIGVLGILKAGGAYVPLDPEYPRERLAYTLQDARVPVIVTQERLLSVLPEHEAILVLLDRPEMQVPAERLLSATVPATADNLAYLIYTSGSTGRAKGVAITHRSAVEMVHWAAGVFPAEDLAGVLLSTSICFDLSVFEIFLPLSRGGAVILATNALELPRLPAAGEVTLINTVPSAMAELVRTGGVPASVRTVNLAGEALPGTLVDEIHAHTAAGQVMNLYGPSEDTTYSTFAEIRPGTAAPSIGRPIDGTRAWILDRAGLPVPPGVPGDLHLGGAGLARGYLGRPDLTAERFVPDAFGGEPGARLYRTGDLVRWMPDGDLADLAFLGRIDHQVKVRGFRIELGEVEAALTRHPAVREAVVAVRGEALNDRHLVAYVTPRGDRPAPRDLRDFLLARLPGPAVPSAFVVLDELPRTPNGKVNRRALPELEADAERSEPYTPPSTPTGEALAGIWSRLLGVERVGANDSFFELGGHSLLASQLVSRIRESFGAEVPLSAVFQAPTLDALAEIVAAANAPVFSGPALQPVPRTGELPLSASQLRQWFLVQLEPESVDYNLPVTVWLEGDLEADALAAALRALVRRHETLRTTFVSVGGRPVAVVAPDVDLPMPLLDLSSTPESDREAAVVRAAETESDRPFDLTRGPLMRALLIRESRNRHLLALTVHHIVFDGFSTAVLLRDLSALYQAEVSDRPADLPALPVQYVDYAAWQQEQLQGPAMWARLDRWKTRLADASRVLDLPTDRPRPAVQSNRGEMIPVTLPPAGAAEIRNLAGREGATLFMVLLAGYASLLSRYTGQEDLNVGTFVANRPQAALEGLIGFFVNTLVLRVDLTGDPSFRELLARVRETSLDAFENQEVPFESLLDELEIGRDLSRSPLFQALFGLQNFAMPTIEMSGLRLRPVTLAQHSHTNGEVAFWMAEEEGTLSGLLQLSTDLFDASTVLRMFRHMERLLAAGAADPGLRLSELPLLSAEETGQILVEWNRPGEREPEPDALVHERFERWAAIRPDAVAVETADRSEVLTYAELNRRGNRLAHRLRRLGIGTDSIVGLRAERSVEYVVGVLGVLKAGGAYMPLDPSLPAERLGAMVRSSGVSVILPLDPETVGSSPDDDRNPAPLAVPESLAYTFFTSGSTGTPKGVLIHHGALANFAETARRLYGLGPDDRVLQFSSLVFDISVEEIFSCWAAGSTLVLRDEEMVASPARFLRACGELDVQMLDLPTAYWHELGIELAKGEVGLPACVRTVIFAGERALQERLAGWEEPIRRGVRLLNSYGPTEACPASSVFEASETVAGASTNGLSIGRPMRGARLYVADFDHRPVPAGVAGELLIAGAGVGRGYAGRPDLTAERFIPDPFADISGVPGERAYRTGDRVRWLRDGNLEFLGRVDHQVKIRGFRIEPGEIAAVLCRYPGVREAVVVPRESDAVGLQLIAYAAAEPGIGVADLREHVKSALPAYMVPADFVLLDALPLTATGKLDRKALPEPAGIGTGVDDGYAPPETATEELLAGIWADLLGRQRVGIFDDFFDLGGHSLLAPQVFARIEETFQVELPLRALFEAPTVAQLATLIEEELLAQIEELSDEEAESLMETF